MLFLLKRLFQRHAHLKGYELGHLIGQCVRLVLHARDISYNRLCRHGAECDDLRYGVSTVCFRNIIDHFIPAIHTEIDIKIGHRNPLRIQKSLKKEIVFDRIQVGNFERISDQRSCTRTPAWTYRYAVCLAPADEVHNNQKVAREPHLVDDIELKFETRTIHFIIVNIERCQPLIESLVR